VGTNVLEEEGELSRAKGSGMRIAAQMEVSGDFLSQFDLSQIVDRNRKVAIENFLQNWQDIFALNDYELGRTNAVKHRIQLNDPGIEPILSKGIDAFQRQLIDLKMMLDCKVIQPSHSPWRSPVVLVRKSDGSLRFCVDYRKVNNVTKKDAYEIPNIEEILIASTVRDISPV
jgi:hypothetical protein